MQFIDKVSSFTTHITFRKYILIMFWGSIKKEYSQLSEMTIKNTSSFPNLISSTQTTDCNRLNAEKI